MNPLNINPVQDFSKPCEGLGQAGLADTRIELSQNEKSSSRDFLSFLNESISKARAEEPLPIGETDLSRKADTSDLQASTGVNRTGEADKNDAPKNDAPKNAALNEDKAAKPEFKDKEASEKIVAAKDERETKAASEEEKEASKIDKSKITAKNKKLGGLKNSDAKALEKAASENSAARKELLDGSNASLQEMLAFSNADARAGGSDNDAMAGLQEDALLALGADGRFDFSPLSEKIDDIEINADFAAIKNAMTQSGEGVSIDRDKEQGKASKTENPSKTRAKNNERLGVIEVKDFRTKVSDEAREVKKDFVREIRQDAKGSIELTMDLGDQSQRNILSLDSQSASSDGSTFQAMLKNQIAENAGEILRAGNIVLRDNNTGSINLVLHPENLGNVKISLELNGKVVVGHISVASREAFNAFGDGADILKNAFIQGGFDDASFDVSFAGNGMQFTGQNQERDDGNALLQGRKIYGDFLEESVSAVFQNADNYYDAADYSVDIVA